MCIQFSKKSVRSVGGGWDRKAAISDNKFKRVDQQWFDQQWLCNLLELQFVTGIQRPSGPFRASGGSRNNQSKSNATILPMNVAAHNILSLAKRDRAAQWHAHSVSVVVM